MTLPQHGALVPHSTRRTTFGARAWFACFVLLFAGLLPSGCFRSSSVITLGHGVGSSRASRGPITVNCETHSVAAGRGVLFENHVFSSGGLEHRTALLMLSSQEFWYSVDPNAEVILEPERTDGREWARGHADYLWEGSAVPSGSPVPAPIAMATPYVSTTSGTVVAAYDPNRISVTVPVDPGAASAPAAPPFLMFRGEQVPAPDGSLFLVILAPDGPKRPTRIATDLDLSQVTMDPDGFVDRILDEQPVLREVLEEGR